MNGGFVIHGFPVNSDCGYCCHWKCIIDVRRVCANVVASEAGGYIFTKEICPEMGLSAQLYSCAECHMKITFTSTKVRSLPCFGSAFRHTDSGYVEPRLCDNTGLYFCQRCHWNTLAVVPARVIRNWDLDPRKVSRSAS